MTDTYTKPRGARMLVTCNRAVTVAAAEANTEADRLEEDGGYVYDMDLLQHGDKVFVLVKYFKNTSDETPVPFARTDGP